MRQMWFAHVGNVLHVIEFRSKVTFLATMATISNSAEGNSLDVGSGPNPIPTPLHGDSGYVEYMCGAAYPKVLSMIFKLAGIASVNLRSSLVLNITRGPSTGTSSLCHSGKPRENISIVSRCISCKAKTKDVAAGVGVNFVLEF